MIAVDTNILVYAHREDSAWHQAADRCMTRLAEDGRSWAIPWPCIHEFLAIATHPRIYDPPTPITDAIQQVSRWLECPSLVTLGELTDYWENLKSCLLSAHTVGPKVHDARIATLCIFHGVTELWSADRDFSRFPGFTTRNPLL